MDVDGVLTDDRVWFGEGGARMVAFNRKDGLGLAPLARRIPVAAFSGADCPGVAERLKELGMEYACRLSNKVESVGNWLREKGLDWHQLVYIGNDSNDAGVLQKAGLGIAVADAHPSCLDAVDCATTRDGGQGAVREVADAILSILNH